MGILALALALPAALAGRLRGRPGLLAALAALLATLALSPRLDLWSERARVAGVAPRIPLRGWTDTPYQHLNVGGLEVRHLYLSGQYAGSFPDPYASETLAHTVACLAPLAGRVLVAKLNADRSPNAVTRLRIQGIPTLIVFKGGHEVRRMVGAREKGEIVTHFVEADGKEGPAHVLVSAWKPGDPVWLGRIDGEPIAAQVRPVPNGFRLANHGVEVKAYVYTFDEANAARLIPDKPVTDSGKKVLCPMPGLVVSVEVTEGQEIKAGETLAVVEAMKMENVLRAERDGVVKTLYAKKGDSLAVDAVILEFA
jgi:biotin carboxyl carrier protein